MSASLWVLGLRLAPHEHGRALNTLPSWLRWLLFITVVVTSSGGAILAVSVVGNRPAVIAFGLFAAASPAVAVIDATAHRIPYLLTGALVITGAVCFMWDAEVTGDVAALKRAAWAALVVGAFGFVLWLPRSGIGPGDVALFAVLGGYAGWVSWPLVEWGIGLGCLVAAVGVSVALLWRRWGEIVVPYGAFLLAGWWTAFMFADRIHHLY